MPGGVGCTAREDARAEAAGLDVEHVEAGEDGAAAGAHGVGERVDVRSGLEEALTLQRVDGGDAVRELVRALPGLDAPDGDGLPGGGDVLELAQEGPSLADVLERDGERAGVVPASTPWPRLPPAASSSNASSATRSIGVRAAIARSQRACVACAMKRAKNVHRRGSNRSGTCRERRGRGGRAARTSTATGRRAASPCRGEPPGVAPGGARGDALAVDDGHLDALLLEVPRGGEPHHAGADDDGRARGAAGGAVRASWERGRGREVVLTPGSFDRRPPRGWRGGRVAGARRDGAARLSAWWILRCAARCAEGSSIRAAAAAPTFIRPPGRPAVPKDLRPPALDDVDRRILDVLATDARATNAAVAARVGIAASTCHARVRALVDRGVIRGFRADVDPRRSAEGSRRSSRSASRPGPARAWRRSATTC